MNSHRNLTNCIRVYKDDDQLAIVRRYNTPPPSAEPQYTMFLDLNYIIGISSFWDYARNTASRQTKNDYECEPGYVPCTDIYLSNGCSFSLEGIMYKDVKEIYQQFKGKKK